MDIVLFSTLIWKVVDFLRQLANLPESKSSVVTQLAAWATGIGAVWVGAHASVTADVTFPGISTSLGALDGGSILLVGLLAASLASALVDVKQGIDSNDSAVKPPLLKG